MFRSFAVFLLLLGTLVHRLTVRHLPFSSSQSPCFSFHWFRDHHPASSGKEWFSVLYGNYMASQGILWDPKLSRQGKRKRKEEERFVESLRQAPWEDPEDPEDPKAQRKYTCYVTMSGHSFRFTVFLYIMIYIYIHYHTLYMHICICMHTYIKLVYCPLSIYILVCIYIYTMYLLYIPLTLLA